MSKQAQGGGVASTSVVTVVLCCLVAMCEGFDLQAAGITVGKIAPALHLSTAQVTWFVSISTFGLMIGSAIGGRLSDRFGRKAVLIGSLAVFGLLSFANGLAIDFPTLLLTRFLTGVGLGGALPNILALVTENSAQKTRNISLGVLYGAMPTGGAVVSLVSLLGGASDWRTVFYVGGLGPLLMVPVLMFLLPDSRELKRVSADAGGGLHPRSVGFALFGDGRAVRTLLLWVAFFLALVAMYVLLNWLPSLMKLRGLSQPHTAWVQVVFNICGAAASVLTGLFMDRLALPKVASAAFLLAAIGLVLLWLAPVEFGISLIVGGIVGGSISTTQALLYALAPQAYPTQIRGTGVGAAVSVGRLGSAVGPLLAGAMLTAGALPQQVAMVLVPTIVVSGAAALLLCRLIGIKGRVDAAAAATAAAH